MDALFVAPDVNPLPSVDEAALIESGVMGSYRRAIGWGSGRKPTAQQGTSFQFDNLKRVVK